MDSGPVPPGPGPSLCAQPLHPGRQQGEPPQGLRGPPLISSALLSPERCQPWPAVARLDHPEATWGPGPVPSGSGPGLRYLPCVPYVNELDAHEIYESAGTATCPGDHLEQAPSPRPRLSGPAQPWVQNEPSSGEIPEGGLHCQACPGSCTVSTTTTRTSTFSY